MSAPEYRNYHIDGHDEFCLAFDAGQPRRILIVPPLFDEMNRMRRVLVSAMRDLAEREVGTLLIDLPGCNESMAQLSHQHLVGWRAAVAACAQQLGATHVASVRGGTLVDDAPTIPHWRLAPVKGSSLLKAMIRTRIAGDREAGIFTGEAQLIAAARSAAIELGGNLVGPAMVEQLATAEPVLVANLTERKLGENIAGSPLWLRAEPQDDALFAASIAADLDKWSVSCGE